MLAIWRFAILLGGLKQLVTSDPAIFIGDFLGYGDRKALCTLYGAYKLPGLVQACLLYTSDAADE